MKPFIAIMAILVGILIVETRHSEPSYASPIGDSTWFEVSRESYPIRCEICGLEGTRIDLVEGYNRDMLTRNGVLGIDDWVVEPWLLCHIRCLRKVLKDVGLIKKKYMEFNEKNIGKGK